MQRKSYLAVGAILSESPKSDLNVANRIFLVIVAGVIKTIKIKFRINKDQIQTIGQSWCLSAKYTLSKLNEKFDSRVLKYDYVLIADFMQVRFKKTLKSQAETNKFWRCLVSFVKLSKG